VDDFLKELGVKRNRSSSSPDDIPDLESFYKGSLPEDRISQMGRILLSIRKERGITVEEIADRTGFDYHLTVQLVGMLETDAVISRDLLQRCFINFSR
jgi:hypothetical protein